LSIQKDKTLKERLMFGNRSQKPKFSTNKIAGKCKWRHSTLGYLSPVEFEKRWLLKKAA